MEQVHLQDLPYSALEKIFEQLDGDTMGNLSKTCKSLLDSVALFRSKKEDSNDFNLLELSPELIHAILVHLDWNSIESMAKTCKSMLAHVSRFESLNEPIMKKKWVDYIDNFFNIDHNHKIDGTLMSELSKFVEGIEAPSHEEMLAGFRDDDGNPYSIAELCGIIELDPPQE